MSISVSILLPQTSDAWIIMDWSSERIA